MKKSKKTNDKLSFKEAMKINMRGYKIWWKLYPKMLISAAVHSIVSSLTPYVGIYLAAQIMNEIAGTKDVQVLTRLVLIALISAAVLALLNAVLLRWKNCENAGQYYKRNKIYTEKLLSLDFSSIDDSRTHDLKSQIVQNDMWSGWGLQRLIWNFSTVVNAIISIAGAVALTVTLFVLQVPNSGGSLTLLNNPLIISAIIIIMLTITLTAPLFSNKASSFWARRAEDARMGNRYFSFFGFMGYTQTRALDIRMYRQDIICSRMAKSNSAFGPKSKIAKDAKGPMGLLEALSAAMSQVFTAIVYIFVCLKAYGGAFGIGSVTQYIASITALSVGVQSLVSVFGALKHNAPFLQTTFEFLDIPNEMKQGTLPIQKQEKGDYEIEFRNVSFKYNNQEKYALKNVSLKFKKGERLAVVGMNGSGKTTFIKLLCRLYDPTEGEILLNGINIKDYNYDDYIAIFAVVFQDFNLFSYSLGQNVSAKKDYDKIKALNCLEEVGFGERVKNMPQGLDTCLYKDFDDKGVEVSGGEAQKIALARALYKDASFIILDEPTAALDPIAEFEIYSKMNDIVLDKTAVFISHRLSSCRFCNDIAVFNEGEIVQRGSHDELVIDKYGKYYELWNAQAQYYVN